MMAKMFYTLDEAKAALGKNEEEIKQLAREGRLREFRDGPRLMFKADQVETLKSELGGGGGDRVDLGVSDTGAPIGLVDSRSASGTGISLVDTDARGGTGSGSGLSNLSPGGSGSGVPLKEDTALAADLGLSGSVGGMPSPGRPGGSRSGSGINVLGGTEEHEAIDPSAQTNISASVHDQVNLEGVGSGSGLLDLTRESDDTSLGAELLDEIAPGGTKAGTKGGTRVGLADSGSGTATVPAFGAAARGRAAGPMLVEAADPLAPAFGGAALAGAIVLLIGGLSLGSAVMGAKVGLLSALEKPNAFMNVLGGGAVLALIFFIIGWIIGKSR
jgi:hypothetical protein